MYNHCVGYRSMNSVIYLELIFACFHVKGDLDVILLKNGTDWYVTDFQNENDSIVIDVDPFDFAYEQNSILFVDAAHINQTIQRRFLNTTGTTDIIDYAYGTSSIEYDWFNNNVYVLQSNIIEVLDFSGRYIQTLYWENMEQVTNMVIDPTVGYIFWTDEGGNAAIARASMDGDNSSHTVLIQNKIMQPLGLTTDSQQGHVYWSDTILTSIERCTYDGTERTVVLQLSFHTPGHLMFHNGTLYWIDNNIQTVNAFSLSSNTSTTLATLPIDLLQSLASIGTSPYRHQRLANFKLRVFVNKEHLVNRSNFIQNNNKQCDQLALVSSYSPSTVCKCSAYFTSTKYGTCIEEEYELPEMILSTSKGLQMYSNGTLTILNENKFNLFTFVDENIMVALMDDVLYRISLQNASVHSQLSWGYELPFWCIEYDWIGENIYFALNTISFGFIIILKWQDGTSELNHDTFEYFKGKLVTDVVVDPEKRLLFACIGGHLERMSMDGIASSTAQDIFISEDDVCYFLFLDVKEENIYSMLPKVFTEHFYAIMYRMTYEGKELTSRHQQYTRFMLFFETYKVTTHSKYWGYNEVTVRQCDKRHGGNCKTILKLGTGMTNIRIPLKKMKYTGHPCQTNNGNCTHFCMLRYTDPFYSCKCYNMYVLQPDGKTCVSYPCQYENRNCSMECVNLGGTNYTCKCNHGFKLAADGKTCYGDMGYTLIEARQNGFRRHDLRSDDYYPVLNTYLGMSVNSIKYDPISMQLYFLSFRNETKSSIIKTNLDGTETRFVVSNTSESIRSFALDWLTREIYWATQSKFHHSDYNISKPDVINLMDILPKSATMSEYSNDIMFLETDVFNGLLYWGRRRVKGGLSAIDKGVLTSRLNLDYMETNIFHLEPKNYKIVPVAEYETIVLLPFTVDSLHHQIYYIEVKDLQVIHLNVCYTDGTGHQLVNSNTMVTNPVTFGDDYIYFIDDLKMITKMRRQTHEKVISRYMDSTSHRLVVIGANMLTSNTSGGMENCSGYGKCWSIVNAWTCLEPEQICDGVNDCYDAHDEHFCSLCRSNCSVVAFDMACYQSDFITFNEVDTGLSEYINWTSHPLSNIISLQTLVSQDCSVQIEMETKGENQMKYLSIGSLYLLHKLRQVVLSQVLRNLIDVRAVHLEGISLLGDIHSTGIGIFPKVEVFKLENSLITDLPSRMFQKTTKLRYLEVSNSHLLRRIDENCFSGLELLESLSITGSNIQHIAGSVFNGLGNLTFLNLSYNNIQLLGHGIFDTLLLLEVLDVRGNDIKLTSELFLQTKSLRMIYCDSFTICCIKPPSVSDSNCTAAKDDISSCSNLIENRILAVFLWIFGIMALVGNLSVLLYRGCVERSVFKKTYIFFVYNLSISDLIMAIYMLIIAYHDAAYDGTYVWNDYTWKGSAFCRLAGVLSMASSEASMMFVTLITIERFIGLKFTFGNIKISRGYAVGCSLVVWFLASLLALIPIFFYPEFYSRSGVCIGIPLTKNNETGMSYSVFVFIGLNCLFCVIIPIGQYLILGEVRRSSKRIQSTQKGRTVTVAKKLAAVVLTDCFCWIPVGILVILSMSGVKITREVYAWVIIFVLPVNAAVNPYLYTLTDIKWNDIKKLFSTEKRNNAK